jgi:hypothetical protein
VSACQQVRTAAEEPALLFAEVIREDQSNLRVLLENTGRRLEITGQDPIVVSEKPDVAAPGEVERSRRVPGDSKSTLVPVISHALVAKALNDPLGVAGVIANNDLDRRERLIEHARDRALYVPRTPRADRD